MLVLRRKRNEQVLIGGQITVEVLQIKGNKVRLGIQAPRDVKVMRGDSVPKQHGQPLSELCLRK